MNRVEGLKKNEESTTKKYNLNNGIQDDKRTTIIYSKK